MEDNIQSMRERVFIAEMRAEAAEKMNLELTEMNMELSNEVQFLKGIKIDSEKINFLEKEVEHSKSIAKASQQQQKELYSAIFDMETLIEDLKSKAFVAETRLEKVEEQCLLLAETNSELETKIDFIQSRAQRLEACLSEVHKQKGSRVEDINNGAKIVADLVLKLALERERIQKKLCSLTTENKILMEELHRCRKKSFVFSNGEVDNTKYSVKGVDLVKP